MVILSLTGLIRTILIILGVMFLLSLVGKTMQARRNIADQQRMKADEEANRKMREKAKENYGKTSISKVDKKAISDSDYTEFEEIEE